MARAPSPRVAGMAVQPAARASHGNVNDDNRKASYRQDVYPPVAPKEDSHLAMKMSVNVAVSPFFCPPLSIRTR